ncbi:MAG: discoidin domain-containing protein [Candidatus Eisenbacteria bacterium]|jgi:hypothetical protein|nr:discoidin domain-containing protein [Candidatus Eisenbacteria bacterium]
MIAMTVGVRRLLVGFAFFAVTATAVTAGERPETAVAPVVTGDGEYTGAPALLADGVLPDEETAWDCSLNVFWIDSSAAFLLDLGSVRRVDHVAVSVDNNDTYRIEASTDGTTFADLAIVPADSGRVEFGMECFGSDVARTDFLSSMAFAPREARFLRLSAIGGDGAYAAGELQVTSMPLPAAGDSCAPAP